jgi:hypothetical protein
MRRILGRRLPSAYVCDAFFEQLTWHTESLVTEKLQPNARVSALLPSRRTSARIFSANLRSSVDTIFTRNRDIDEQRRIIAPIRPDSVVNPLHQWIAGVLHCKRSMRLAISSVLTHAFGMIAITCSLVRSYRDTCGDVPLRGFGRFAGHPQRGGQPPAVRRY